MAVGQTETFLDSRDTSVGTAEHAVRQVGAELPYCDRNSDAVTNFLASVGAERIQQYGLDPNKFLPQTNRETLNSPREGLAAVQSERKDFRDKFRQTENAASESFAKISIPAVTQSVNFSDQLAESYRCIAEECLKTGNLEAFHKLTEITDRDLPQAQAQAIRAMAPQTKSA
jgi:hypothetical protein